MGGLLHLLDLERTLDAYETLLEEVRTASSAGAPAPLGAPPIEARVASKRAFAVRPVQCVSY
jgi:hypothetical protein